MLAYVLSGIALLSGVALYVNSQRPPGLTPGTRRMLLDQGNPRAVVDSVDATVRAANEVRS
jgi:uncharacterized alpha-E superfamily protein